MKKIQMIAMAILMIASSLSASAQDLNEIVKKHIEAIGGVENWKKVNSMTSDITSKMQGVEIKVQINQLQKKGMRVDFNVAGKTGYTIITEKEGWNMNPFMGHTKPEPVTAEQLKSAIEDLDIMDEFMVYKDYGRKIDNLGSDEVEGTDCYKIAIANAKGKTNTYFIDKSNNHIIKKTSKEVVDGKESEMSVTYSNYKKLDGAGIVIPMAQSGDMGEMEYNKVEVNKINDMSLFQAKELVEVKK